MVNLLKRVQSLRASLMDAGRTFSAGGNCPKGKPSATMLMAGYKKSIAYFAGKEQMKTKKALPKGELLLCQI